MTVITDGGQAYCAHSFTEVGESRFEVRFADGLEVEYLIGGGDGGSGRPFGECRFREKEQLKVTREEQEKMRQDIEKQLKTMDGQKVVTVMFHDRRGVSSISDSFRARECAAQSLSALLTGGSVVAAASSLPHLLNASDLTDFARHRTRRRTTPSINKFTRWCLMHAPLGSS